MKTALSLVILAVATAAPGFAQWAVIDGANLTQSITNYAALVEQLSNQATQISNQVQQIRQFETQLKRLGDMATVKNLVGFSEFRADLELPTQITTWAQGLTHVDGSALFGDTRGGVFHAIGSDFTDFDGATVARDATAYKAANDMTVSVDNFKTVQNDVYTRREELKQAIASTSEALQAADTEAEEQKLDAVLNAQYGQLAAVDREIALSAAEVQVKAAESTAMGNAQSEADAEARRHLTRQEISKLSTTFKPTYECLLQYVTERPLAQ